jgi:regulation of enolase protein 1 (concanavalin A-like superfamily)
VWQNQDIGTTGAAGSTVYTEGTGTFTIRGAGADIWGGTDAFQFASQPSYGNTEIVARVASVQYTHEWAKAAVMIREGLGASAKYVMLVVSAGNGISLQSRAATGGSSAAVNVGGLQAPKWVKLERGANTFTAWYSADGASWTYVGGLDIAMNQKVYAGLAVCSHSAGVLCTAVFDHVQATLGPPPGTGTGLRADYFNGQKFESLAITRTDAGLDFDWGINGSPNVSLGSDFFSARWTGEIQARYSEVYTLSTLVDDAMRLWLDDELLIDNWATIDPDQPAVSNSVSVPLVAGERRRLTVEYYEYTYEASTRLQWQSASEPLQVIPVAQLYPAAGPLSLQKPTELRSPGATGNTVALRWDAAPGSHGVLTYDVYQGGNLVGSTTEGSLTTGGLSLNTPYTFHLKARDASGQTSGESDPATITTPGVNAPPAPWSTMDIGNVLKPGGAVLEDGRWTVSGSGADIWNTGDEFRYAWRPLSGDGALIARLTFQVPADPWAKAGIMLRDNLSSGGRHATLAWTPGNSLNFLWRSTFGAGSFNTNFPVARRITGKEKAPIWLKLTRSGSTIAAAYSFNGADPSAWVNVDSEAISGLPAAAFIGLAVTSHNASALSSAIFDSVTLDYAPTVALTSPANGASVTAGSPVTLAATASSTTATIAKVEFFDGAAKLGEDTTAPYTFTWTSPAPGSHTITAKAIDSFGVAATSAPINIVGDTNSLPSAWRQQIVDFDPSDAISDISQVLPGDDFDHDGLTNLQEYQQGSDPNDFYNGIAPVLEVVSGNNQGDLPGTTLPQKLVVRVKNANGAVAKAGNVSFTITSSTGGSLSPSEGAIDPTAGTVGTYVTLPSTAGTTVTIKASAHNSFGTTEIVFTLLVGDSSLWPAPPANVIVQAEHGSSTAVITWEDKANNEMEYWVDRKEYGGAYVHLATLAPNAVTYTDSSIVPDHLYLYRITAHNDAP